MLLQTELKVRKRNMALIAYCMLTIFGISSTREVLGQNAVALEGDDVKGFCQSQFHCPVEVMHFDFMPDEVFEIYTVPGKMVDVVLEPGEKVLDVPLAGEDEHWKIRAVFGTSGLMKQQHVFIRSEKPGCRGALLINTDRRIYHINLSCTEDSWMEMVKWNYMREGDTQRLVNE
ncbi:TrbG/VirB9 family P-type conjugative transfer protein [Prosthecochloris sp. ZM]|uniref:TrbG/VirB9 family P-type conjugative transfer protein n=1 Tax=Prosthecochloris sp. ZM TaxID=2283143 RepID=UPI00142DC0CB|nr:TrbG/VirB9 family P-type conjugative transfer protein [Prosthecochloris sp. ZM]